MRKSSETMAMPANESQTHKTSDKLEKVEEISEPKHSPPNIYSVTRAQTASRRIKQRSSTLVMQKRKRGDWGEFDLAHTWSPEDRFSKSRVSQSTDHGERPGRESYTSTDSLYVNRPYATEPAKQFEVRTFLNVRLMLKYINVLS